MEKKLITSWFWVWWKFPVTSPFLEAKYKTQQQGLTEFERKQQMVSSKHVNRRVEK